MSEVPLYGCKDERQRRGGALMIFCGQCLSPSWNLDRLDQLILPVKSFAKIHCYLSYGGSTFVLNHSTLDLSQWAALFEGK